MVELRDDAIKHLFEIQTGLYRPSGWGMTSPAADALGLPLFTIRRVEMMKFDPDIRLGMSIKTAPCLTVRFRLNGEPNLVNFIARELQSIWYYAMPRILESFWYSRSGGELIYKLGDDDLIHFGELRDVYPADITTLTQSGALAGIRISEQSLMSQEIGPGYATKSRSDVERGLMTLWTPKCFLYVHNRRFNNWNGKSDLLGCFSPWLDKWDQSGALAIRRMWFYKNAYSGFFIQHPPGEYVGPPDINGQPGIKIPYRDLARRLAETIKTGGVCGIPYQVNNVTNENMWKIEQPQLNGDAEGLHQYLREIRIEILRGLEIPDEIISSMDSGSFAGRTMPMMAFITSMQTTVRGLALAVKEQILEPLAKLNFGTDDFEIFAEADVDRLMPGSPFGEGGDEKTAAASNGSDTTSKKGKKSKAKQKQFSQDQLPPYMRRLFRRSAAAFYGYAVPDCSFVLNGQKGPLMPSRWRPIKIAA